MPSCTVSSFADPHEYQLSFVHSSNMRAFVTAPGEYRAELTLVDLDRLQLQRGRTTLPMLTHSSMRKTRSSLFFLADAQQSSVHHSGMELSPGEIMHTASGSEHYNRYSAECRWGALSLSVEDLAAAGRAATGYELTPPTKTRLIRPPPHLMSRLLYLHEAAGQLAATIPDVLMTDAVAKAIAQELTAVFVKCVTASPGDESPHPGRSREPVMRRLEQFLDANEETPLYLAEVCEKIGVSERTLRLHCQEHLQMSPHRYLWMRRMTLARRSLSLAAPANATVTQIATEHGFWELGRFAVSYRKLFGETPSATLRKPPGRTIALQP